MKENVLLFKKWTVSSENGYSPSLIETDSQGSLNGTDIRQKQIVDSAFLLNPI